MRRPTKLQVPITNTTLAEPLPTLGKQLQTGLDHGPPHQELLTELITPQLTFPIIRAPISLEGGLPMEFAVALQTP